MQTVRAILFLLFSTKIESPGQNQKKRSNDSPLYTIVGYDPAEPPMKLKLRLVKNNREKPSIYIDRDYVPGLPYENPNEIQGGSIIKTEPGEQTQEAPLNLTEDFSGDDSKPSTSSADDHSAEIKNEGQTFEADVSNAQTDDSSFQSSIEEQLPVISAMSHSEGEPRLILHPIKLTHGKPTYRIISKPGSESTQTEIDVLPLISEQSDIFRESADNRDTSQKDADTESQSTENSERVSTESSQDISDEIDNSPLIKPEELTTLEKLALDKAKIARYKAIERQKKRIEKEGKQPSDASAKLRKKPGRKSKLFPALTNTVQTGEDPQTTLLKPIDKSQVTVSQLGKFVAYYKTNILNKYIWDGKYGYFDPDDPLVYDQLAEYVDKDLKRKTNKRQDVARSKKKNQQASETERASAEPTSMETASTQTALAATASTQTTTEELTTPNTDNRSQTHSTNINSDMPVTTNDVISASSNENLAPHIKTEVLADTPAMYKYYSELAQRSKSQAIAKPESIDDTPQTTSTDPEILGVVEFMPHDNEQKMDTTAENQANVSRPEVQNSSTGQTDEDTDSQSSEDEEDDSTPGRSVEQLLRDYPNRWIMYSSLTALEKLAWENGKNRDSKKRSAQKKKNDLKGGKQSKSSTIEPENDSRSKSTDNDVEPSDTVNTGMDSQPSQYKEGKNSLVDSILLKEYLKHYLKITFPKNRKLKEYGFNGKKNLWSDEKIAEKMLEHKVELLKKRQKTLYEKRQQKLQQYPELLRKTAELKKKTTQNQDTKKSSNPRISSSRETDDAMDSQSSGTDAINTMPGTSVDQPLTDDTSTATPITGEMALEKLARKYALNRRLRLLRNSLMHKKQIPIDQPPEITKEERDYYVQNVLSKYARTYGDNLTIYQLALKVYQEQKQMAKNSDKARYEKNKPSPNLTKQKKIIKKKAATQTTTSSASTSKDVATSLEDPENFDTVSVGTNDLVTGDGSTTSPIQNQDTIDAPPNPEEMERIKRQFEEYRQSLLEPLPIKSEPIDVKSGEYQNDAINDILGQPWRLK